MSHSVHCYLSYMNPRLTALDTLSICQAVRSAGLSQEAAFPACTLLHCSSSTLLSTTSLSFFHDVECCVESVAVALGSRTCRMRSRAPAPLSPAPLCSSSQPSAVVLGRFMSPLYVTSEIHTHRHRLNFIHHEMAAETAKCSQTREIIKNNQH